MPATSVNERVHLGGATVTHLSYPTQVGQVVNDVAGTSSKVSDDPARRMVMN